MTTISIVVPAYNEQRRIKQTIVTLQRYLRDRYPMYELIIVDDGSTDSTYRVAKRHANKHTRVIRYNQNRGKGHAVRTGMLLAQHDYVLFSDADLSTPIEELDKFIPLLDRHDFLIASRDCPGSQRIEDQSMLRKLMGRTFNLAVRLIVGCNVIDSQCGFKVFKRSVARELFTRQTFDRFAFDVELLHIASQLGFTFKEVPVIWKNDERSTVRPIRDSLLMFLDIVKIRLNSLKGIYRAKIVKSEVSA